MIQDGEYGSQFRMILPPAPGAEIEKKKYIKLILPKIALTEDKKYPYLIFVTDDEGNLSFADAGDGSTSLFHDTIYNSVTGESLDNFSSELGVLVDDAIQKEYDKYALAITKEDWIEGMS